MKLLTLIAFLSLISISVYSQTETDSTTLVCFFQLQPQPEFPGGMDSLANFIKANSNWVQGQETVEGIVFVQFNVNEDGSISDVKVVRGLCESCNKEAIRLISILPKWKPAMVEGNPQKTRMVYPIKFKL
jgi:TonB family protein